MPVKFAALRRTQFRYEDGDDDSDHPSLIPGVARAHVCSLSFLADSDLSIPTHYTLQLMRMYARVRAIGELFVCGRKDPLEGAL